MRTLCHFVGSTVWKHSSKYRYFRSILLVLTDKFCDEVFLHQPLAIDLQKLRKNISFGAFVSFRDHSLTAGSAFAFDGLDININAMLFINSPQATDYYTNIPNRAWAPDS